MHDESEEYDEQKIICVLGMHRSGTSFITRILNILGIYLGPEEHILGPDSYNPTGYWEHKLLSYLSEDILLHLGGNHIELPAFPQEWEYSLSLADLRQRARAIIQEDFSRSKVWGWKDPRNSLLLPFWKQIVQPTHFIICLRNPIDVAQSLRRRNNITLEKGIDLWLTYLKSALSNTANQKRIFIFYENLMGKSSTELGRLSEFLGITDLALKLNAQKQIQQFVDEGLQHHKTNLINTIDHSSLAFPEKALYFALRLYVNGYKVGGENFEKSFDTALNYFSNNALYAKQLLNQLVQEKAETNQSINEAYKKTKLLETQISEKDQTIQVLTNDLLQKETRSSLLIDKVIDQEQKLQLVADQLGEKELNSQVLSIQITEQQKQLLQQDLQAQLLIDQLKEKEKKLQTLTTQVKKQQQQLLKRDSQVLSFKEQLEEEEKRLQALITQMAEQQQQLLHRDSQILSFKEQLEGEEKTSQALISEIATARYLLSALDSRLRLMTASNSWRLTLPLRVIGNSITHRGIIDSDRKIIKNVLLIAYRKIPLPYMLKKVIRNFLVSVTGWSKTPIWDTFISNNELSLSKAGPPSESPVYLSQEHNKRSTIPFLNDRRPHGQRRVAFLTNQLLDWYSGYPRFGGGERYALELAKLLQDLGLNVTFFQPSFQGVGEAEYFGFPVKKFPTGDSYGEFNHGSCTYFTDHTMEYDHIYYHLPEYASGKFREDGLMTCHGIWFDHNNYEDSRFRHSEWFSHLYRAFSNPLGIVSVDTHSITFVRSLWPEMKSKLRFIPNFYNEKMFFPSSTENETDKITILFPRRSQINRGSRIFSEIVDNIKSKDVNIVWVGEGDDTDTDIIKKVCFNDNRVKFYASSFDEMPKWYRLADIVVIPSIASEGTSLSCIEALASGCAVIATNVGGLNDLIIDNYNGLLVDIEPNAIAQAINRLVENESQRKKLQRIAPESVQSLEISQWRLKWIQVFYDYGWINKALYDAWILKNIPKQAKASLTVKTDQWIILTRNAIHGGVESMIHEESKYLNAPVIVCGGLDFPETCPFEYKRIDNPRSLEAEIQSYDIILYHWLPDWAIDVVKKSGKHSIEFVHRKDTSDNDKLVPTGIVTHSEFLAKYILDYYGRSSRVLAHPIDTNKFTVSPTGGRYIGGITSYYRTKGIDIFLKAWSLIQEEFPSIPVRFYGSGDQINELDKLAKELGVAAEFCTATSKPWETLREFRCIVIPSRVEGFPVSILEALAMNIPVVTSDLEGMIEFNAKANQRGYPSYISLSKYNDIEDLAAVIKMVLNFNSPYEAREYIKKYFNPQAHCDALQTAYREFKYLSNVGT